MLKEVQSLDFALHEAALFLDINNTDSKAIKYFNHYRQLSEQARERFESQFGPLTNRAAEVTDCWRWTEGPWPWECDDKERSVL